MTVNELVSHLPLWGWVVIGVYLVGFFVIRCSVQKEIANDTDEEVRVQFEPMIASFLAFVFTPIWIVPFFLWQFWSFGCSKQKGSE